MKDSQDSQDSQNPKQILAAIEATVIDFQQKFNSEVKAKRIAFLISVLIGIVLFVGDFLGKINIAPWGSVTLWVFAILSLLVGLGTNPDKTHAEIEKLQSNKKIYFLSDAQDKEKTHFDKLVEINVENLSEYYLLVQEHTKQSFNLSKTVSFVGFGLISLGVIVGFLRPEYKDMSYVSTASGTLIRVQPTYM